MPRRVGFGYDIHRLRDGGRLVLGGVAFPDFPRGADVTAYDGDVVVHAVADAVLGALAAGSIDDLLPDVPGASGASSLERAGLARVLAEHRARLVNLDCTIVAIEPRIMPVADAIRAALAGALDADASRVGVKAKTGDGLGPEGRGEAVSATAIVQLDVRRRLWPRGRRR